jgi:hypothetical protein
MNRLYQILMIKRLGRHAYKKLAAEPWYRAACRGLTYTWFAFTLVWFWSNWKQMDSFYKRLGRGETLAVWFAVFLIATIALALWEAIRARVFGLQWEGTSVVDSMYARLAWSCMLAVIVIAVTLLAGQAAPEMVYKTF